MWLFTRYGFYSAACASTHEGALDEHRIMVRARRKAHLENLQTRFPLLASAKILSISDRDYKYRIVIPKTDWVQVVSEIAAEQTWANFKNEAARFQGKAGSGYNQALHDVWGVMNRFQRAE